MVVAASAAVQDGIAEISAVRKGIEDLKTKYANAVFDVSVTDGMEKAKAARREIREPRYAVERTRKESKSKLAALGKSIDSEAASITAELLALEVPIDDQIKAEEQRSEADEAGRKRESAGDWIATGDDQEAEAQGDQCKEIEQQRGHYLSSFHLFTSPTRWPPIS